MKKLERGLELGNVSAGGGGQLQSMNVSGLLIIKRSGTMALLSKRRGKVASPPTTHDINGCRVNLNHTHELTPL